MSVQAPSVYNIDAISEPVLSNVTRVVQLRLLGSNRTALGSNNTATLLRLPTEIWIKIARFASEPVWPETQFYPPRKDIKSVLGFKAACKKFEDIVEIVESETVHLDKEILRTNFACATRLHSTRVRNIHIQMEFVQDNIPLSDFILSSRLHSFSIARLEENFHNGDYYYYGLMNNLSCSASRHTLMQMSLNLTPHLVNREFATICKFQNLQQLRLYNDMTYVFILPGMPRHDEAKVWTNPVANHLSTLLSSLTHLRYLSLHIHLDTLLEIQRVTRVHSLDLDHLQPSEGYSVHYSDCPMCTEEYDHSVIIQRENREAIAMAEDSQSLEVISFMHYWRRGWQREEGQRKIWIQRNEKGITVERD